MNIYPLGEDWGSEEEKKEVAKRILALSDLQIDKLFGKVGISFSEADMEDGIKEIRKERYGSMHLDILLTEAYSKDELIKWVSCFEKNKE
jgi:hypothetical protein